MPGLFHSLFLGFLQFKDVHSLSIAAHTQEQRVRAERQAVRVYTPVIYTQIVSTCTHLSYTKNNTLV